MSDVQKREDWLKDREGREKDEEEDDGSSAEHRNGSCCHCGTHLPDTLRHQGCLLASTSPGQSRKVPA